MEYLDNWYNHQVKFMEQFGASDEQFEAALKERVVDTIGIVTGKQIGRAHV